MKKLYQSQPGFLPLFKIDLKMRLTLLCLILPFLGMHAHNSYAQKVVTLNYNKTTVSHVLEEIESRTDYRFVYKVSDIDLDKEVKVKAHKEKVSEVLNKIFKDTDVDYDFFDDQVFLVKKDNPLSFNIVQDKIKITGMVTDNNGVPLPGVNITVKGSSEGTTTDFDGNYEIEVEKGEVLKFSSVGFEDQEITVGDDNTIDVTMKEGSALDEVVVVGYGTEKKEDLTGSISVLEGEDIASRSVTNTSNALQGAIAGVSVTRGSSEPGAGNTIRIRGINTLEGSSSPLILVDDVPVESINDVNPDEIESISVLKDGAASSIYGARAAAGVIIITTKRGEEGRFSASYNGEFIMNTPAESRKGVNAKRYMQMDNEKMWNDNGNSGDEDPSWDSDYIEDYRENHLTNPDQFPITNWKDLILKDTYYGNRHNIAISGGSKKIKSNLNMGYEYQNALYSHKDFQRYTARFNNDIKVSDKIGANVDLAVKLTTKNSPVIDPTNLAINYAPVYPAVWEDGRLAGGQSGGNIYGELQKGGFIKDKNYKFYGKVGIYYKPLKSLKLSLNLAPSFIFDKYKKFNKAVPYWDFDDPNKQEGPHYIDHHNEKQTYLLENRRNKNTITTQALINYNDSFGKHNISGVLGYEEYSKNNEILRVKGDEYISNDYPFLNQAPSDRVFDNGSNISENAYISSFGRLSYNFDRTYYLQGNIRIDGSSRFGKDYRWGSFPSVSAGWVISNESFMSPMNKTISFLKLRASYGSLGNDRLGNYLYQSTLQFADALIAKGNNVEVVRAAAQRYLAVEDVTWETTISKNLGLDISMFNSKLSLTAEYYIKSTKDMLLGLSVPTLIGYDDPTVNVGSMKTKGWELTLSYRDNIGDFRYSASFNIFDSKSIIGNINGKRLISDNKISEEGEEYRSWYGYISDGIYQTQEEVDNSATTSAAVKPGDIKYRDVSGPDGVPDGVINELDKQPLRGYLPRYQYGGTLNLSYKGFDLGLTIQGVGKQEFYLNQYFIRPFINKWQVPNTIYDNNYYSNYNTSGENLKAKYPRLSETSGNNNYRFSDFWLIDGAYLRVKNITIGYTLPNHIVENSPLTKLRFYISGNDIFTIDNLPKGIDPEQQSGYLMTKSFLLGIKANF